MGLNDKQLEYFLSAARWKAFRKNCDSVDSACSLYEQNVRFCARYYITVHFFEITLRNEINARLCQGIGERWFEQPGALIFPQTRQLNDAVQRLKKQGKRIIYSDDVVSELTLGFWVGILRKNYEQKQQYWRKFLYCGFSGRPAGYGRKELFNRFDSIRHFRNRVFHHERIVHQHPEEKLRECLDALGWINQGAYEWAVEILSKMP